MQSKEFSISNIWLTAIFSKVSENEFVKERHPPVTDREFEFYDFFSFLKFNEFYEFFFGWKKIRKKIVILQIIDV